MGRAERVLEYSIRKHTESPVEITWMRCGDPPLFDGWRGSAVLPYTRKNSQWATGFTCFRWTIPEQCNYEGYAIYLDVDMVLLGDIAGLYEYRKPGLWMATKSGVAVMVIDCAAGRAIPPIAELKDSTCQNNSLAGLVSVRKEIPMAWNQLDSLRAETKLIHYTSMFTQPWKPWPERFRYPPHAHKAAAGLWFDYEQEALAAENAA